MVKLLQAKIGFTFGVLFLFGGNFDERSVLEGTVDKLSSFRLILFVMNFYFGALHINVALECNV